MTNERARTELEQLYMSLSEEKKKALDVAFKAMEQAIPVMYYPQVDGITPTVVAQADGEYISKSDVLDLIEDMTDQFGVEHRVITEGMISLLPSVAIPSAEPKKCKDCKWWRDSDGAYRRGVRAESQCPINRREVLEGNGYCYVFEPQESEG